MLPLLLLLLLLLLSLTAVLQLETIEEEGGSNCRALTQEKRWRSLRTVCVLGCGGRSVAA